MIVVDTYFFRSLRSSDVAWMQYTISVKMDRSIPQVPVLRTYHSYCVAEFVLREARFR
jgi:hypothetical protein